MVNPIFPKALCSLWVKVSKAWRHSCQLDLSGNRWEAWGKELDKSFFFSSIYLFLVQWAPVLLGDDHQLTGLIHKVYKTHTKYIHKVYKWVSMWTILVICHGSGNPTVTLHVVQQNHNVPLSLEGDVHRSWRLNHTAYYREMKLPTDSWLWWTVLCIFWGSVWAKKMNC